MTTLRQLKAEAKRLGAEVNDEKIGYSHMCEVIAPAGKFWSEGDTHIMVSDCYQPWKPDYEDLLSRMGYGVEDCTDPDCDWCHPLED